MSNTVYVVGGALGGAMVKIALEGDWSRRAFLSGLASIILGVALTTLAAHFFPSIGQEEVVLASASSIITAVSGGLFRRVGTVKIRASIAGVEIESEGEIK